MSERNQQKYPGPDWGVTIGFALIGLGFAATGATLPIIAPSETVEGSRFLFVLGTFLLIMSGVFSIMTSSTVVQLFDRVAGGIRVAVRRLT